MTTTFFDHWREAPEDDWRWPNFSPSEIACRGTGKLLINEPALDKLQALRDRLGKPLIVRSASSPRSQGAHECKRRCATTPSYQRSRFSRASAARRSNGTALISNHDSNRRRYSQGDRISIRA